MSGIRVMVVSLLAQEITLKVKPRKLWGTRHVVVVGFWDPYLLRKEGLKVRGNFPVL